MDAGPVHESPARGIGRAASGEDRSLLNCPNPGGSYPMAMMYAKADADRMAEEYRTIAGKYEALIVAFQGRAYRTPRAEEFALHGLGRRLAVLKECIEIVFGAIPLELDGIPTAGDRQLATIALQAFLINVFGCVDNLARIWVEERDVRLPNGKALPDGRIGMGGRYNIVRESFSSGFRAYLDSRSDWLSEMERFRHALAHRIPPYIPPYAVDPKNQAAYAAFEPRITEAIRRHDFEGVEKLETAQRSLTFFRPWLTHSFQEEAPMLVIHPQMLADFNTVDEMAHKMLAELNSLT
jgi:hypothetical protein